MDKPISETQKFLDFLSDKSDSELFAMVKSSQTLMTYYRCAILEIETKFRVLDEQFSLQHERNPIANIKSRLKSLNSIREKLERKGLPLSVPNIENNLNDVAGVRVICGFIDDIYMLADCLAQQDDVKVLAIKDYIRNPKDNGYRSLHMIVEVPIFLCDEKKLIKVEVQFRTIAMESWASLEHRMRYKKDVDPELIAKTADELLRCAEMSNELDLKMQNIRNILE